MNERRSLLSSKFLHGLPLAWLRALAEAGSRMRRRVSDASGRSTLTHCRPEEPDMESAIAGRASDSAMGALGAGTVPGEHTPDRAQAEDVYAFISLWDPEGISLFSIVTDDGSGAVVLFDEPLTAEAFVFIEELGEGWQVFEQGALETATLLDACSLSDIDYVALNPPSSAISIRWNLQLIRIADFAASLRTAREKRV